MLTVNPVREKRGIGEEKKKKQKQRRKKAETKLRKNEGEREIIFY